MKRKIVCAILVIVLSVSYMPTCSADESGFTDVPADHWAKQYITKAANLGIIGGVGDMKFGLGFNVTRSQFAAMLTRLFAWEKVVPETPSFSDNADKSAWFYSEIETALLNGAITGDSDRFRPEEYITREDMAVMLVRALGYNVLADNAGDFGMTFTDVKTNRGYITLASDFGIITGIDDTKFDPSGFASREQAAAMMVRLYDRYSDTSLWNHAFYAISSYSQRDLIRNLDGISFGWSKLQYSADGGVYLNTTNSGGNEFNIPSAADTPLDLARQNDTPMNLNVFMSTAQSVTLPGGTKSNAPKEILLNSDNRTEAVLQIAEAVTNLNFDGVTVDFEEMRGEELKTGLNIFLSELKQTLGNKKLFICVHPKMRTGSYFDAYDFRKIGEICDKVIVMAHDYEAKTMDASSMNAGFTTTPVTPFENVYYALKAAADKNTGVQDKNKLALAISFGSIGWSLQNGKVINASGMKPVPEDIYRRLSDPATVMNYSNRYRNPYITYYDTKDNTDNIVWYEDERSVGDKIALARMLGIHGVSYWRLGLIPDYSDPGREIYYDLAGIIGN